MVESHKYVEWRCQTQEMLQYDSIHMKFKKKQTWFLWGIGRGWGWGNIGTPGWLVMFYFFDLGSGYTCSVCDNLIT